MPSIQVLTHALDRRFATPARLSEIVGAGEGMTKLDALIGPAAESADPAAALVRQKRVLDQAREMIEGLLRGRLLYRQRYRSRQFGSALHELELPQWPAQAEALEVLGIALDSYRLNEEDHRYLYRDNGWPQTTWTSDFTQQPIAGTEYDNYRIDFWAGYLMPGQIDLWVADQAYIANSSTSVGTSLPAFGSWTLPTDPTNKLRFECTTAGTTASSEPTWPTAYPWTPATAYSTGDWALATNGPIGLWFEATAGGTSGATDSDEPTWPLEAGETADDNGITWTARDELTFAEGPDTLVWTGHFAEELPVSLQEMAALLAIELAKKTAGVTCKDKDAEKCARKFIYHLRLAA